MCLLSVYFSDNPKEDEYQVIIASNRDEFLPRPTKPASFWGENGQCISGMDADVGSEGGTWLGMSKETGRIGALVNIASNDARDSEKKSRGSLVTDFISSEVNMTEYLQKTNKEKNDYRGFHLVLLERGGTGYKMNILSSSQENSIFEINPGISIVANSHYDKPWKKVGYAREKFSQVTHNYNSMSKKDALVECLFSYLTDKTCHYPDENITHQLGPTPGSGTLPGSDKVRQFVKPEWLSSVFVTHDLGYGTRTHTLILIDPEGNCDYVEKTLDIKYPEPPKDWITSNFSFKIPVS